MCVSSDVMFVCRLTSCLSTDEIKDRENGTQMTTNDGDTGNVRLAITINKAQGKIVRKMRYRYEYGLFSHGQLLCCMFKSR